MRVLEDPPTLSPQAHPPAPLGPPPPRRGRPVGEWLTAAALLLPNLALLAVFTYRPLIDNIRLSFTDWTLSAPTLNYIGLQNYSTWLHDANAHQVLRNTAIFTVATVGLSMMIGLGLALLLDRQLRGRNLVRSAIFAPFVLSGTAVGLAFQFVFDPHFGLLSDLAHRVGGDGLIGARQAADGELRSAGELDRELDRAEERDQRRTDHEDRRDDEPRPSLADERERGLAGVEVVAELVHGAHQSFPSVVGLASDADGPLLLPASSACLRSAIVWRRSASPRERPARRAAEPFATEASTGARNCARPR